MWFFTYIFVFTLITIFVLVFLSRAAKKSKFVFFCKNDWFFCIKLESKIWFFTFIFVFISDFFALYLVQKYLSYCNYFVFFLFFSFLLVEILFCKTCRFIGYREVALTFLFGIFWGFCIVLGSKIYVILQLCCFFSFFNFFLLAEVFLIKRLFCWKNFCQKHWDLFVEY